MTVRHKVVLNAASPNVQAVLKMTKGDTSSHDIYVTLRNGAENVTFDGTESAYLHAKKPDGTTSVMSGVLYAHDGAYPDQIVFTLTQLTLAATGRVQLRVVIDSIDGAELFSPVMAVDVAANPALDNDITSQSEYTALTNAKLDAEAWAKGTKNGVAVSAGADQYHKNSKYYSEQAASSASDANTRATAAGSSAATAEAYAKGTVSGEAVSSGATGYNDNAKYYAEQAAASAAAASGSSSGASGEAAEAEAWAVGKKNGTDVGSNADQYQNNAKYYAEQAASSASDANTRATAAGSSAATAEAYAKGTVSGEAVSSGATGYHDNAKYYAEQAAASATAASGSASTAGTKAEDAEAWAVGKKSGVDVSSGADQYHNNAKYHSDAAAGSASTAGSKAEDAEAWAIGKKNGVDVESTADQYNNNAKYHAQQAAASATAAAQSAAAAASGVKYIGAVNYYSSLPSNPSPGDAYTVKYKGTSGSDPDGREYSWGNYEGTYQWIELGVSYQSKQAASAGTDESLVTTGEKYNWNNKQDALSEGAGIGISSGVVSFKASTISGYDATKVQALINDEGTAKWTEGTSYSQLNNAQYGGNE